ncbi:MAG: 16S rRNA (cytidine(1402)-2'-O)-methyltransferase [Bacteroidota bacterium]
MSKLYIVPTPIGNLEDITLRAVRILKEVNLILAEDTRNTKILLNHFDIKTPMHSHHSFNEHRTVEQIIQRLRTGETIALVSDAGTPSISDPGYLLVKNCIESNIEIECLPGATALIPALVNSGLPNGKFCFEGFLPHKKGRQKRLSQLADEERTMVFYESPFRLQKTLEQFVTVFGEERRASVSRELSKIYEETIRGTLKEIINFFSGRNIKGEIVIVVEGKRKTKG